MWKKIKTHPWWTVIAVVLIAAVVWLVYRQWFAPKPGPNLITATVTRGDIEDSVLATGAIQAAQLTDVGSQVSGQLKKLYVKVGDNVKQGQLIQVFPADAEYYEFKFGHGTGFIDKDDVRDLKKSRKVKDFSHTTI